MKKNKVKKAFKAKEKDRKGKTMVKSKKDLEIEKLRKQVKERDNLLKLIAKKCVDFSGYNHNGNPSIGFRKIEELTKTFDK